MTVKELIAALNGYPDDMPVHMNFDFGSGCLERGVSNVVSTDEWDEQRVPVTVLLVEEDPNASEY